MIFTNSKFSFAVIVSELIEKARMSKNSTVRSRLRASPSARSVNFSFPSSQNSIIYESGTGSGCLSTNISSILSNKGHLYTFEFNKERVDKLKDLFSLLKLNDKITITHRDVIENGFEIN